MKLVPIQHQLPSKEPIPEFWRRITWSWAGDRIVVGKRLKASDRIGLWVFQKGNMAMVTWYGYILMVGGMHQKKQLRTFIRYLASPKTAPRLIQILREHYHMQYLPEATLCHQKKQQ